MRTFLPMLLLAACDAGVTFEEEPPIEHVAPSGSAAPPQATTPVDGRPDNAPASPDTQARNAWPPVVVPQGPRERTWEWDLEIKGNTNAQRLRDNPSEEEGLAIELAQARADGHTLDEY